MSETRIRADRAAITDIHWWRGPSRNDVWPLSVEPRKSRLPIVNPLEVVLLASAFLTPPTRRVSSQGEFGIGLLRFSLLARRARLGLEAATATDRLSGVT
jgi:hypothetical protein